MNLHPDLFALAYLIASVCFILGLKGLSSPATARRGNQMAIAGMVLAVGVTLAHPTVAFANLAWVLGGLALGAIIGVPVALKVRMTAMPELVAILHSFVGLAAVLVGIGTFQLHRAHGDAIGTVQTIEVFVGVFIGAITFTGSVVAFGKLSGRLGSAPVVFSGQHALNLALAVLMIGLGVAFSVTLNTAWLYAMTAVALILGITLIIPIGGADMPVIVSMLNSYSGWAASATGFMLNNNLLIVTGALVGSSGAILSYIMCRAMNRSFLHVILGGFGGDEAAAAATATGKTTKAAAVEDAVFMLANAAKVIIVPGYGMAVAQAQHAVRDLTDLLQGKGVDVRFAIHPVAGRMPGHMNVLLAEADIPYDIVYELDEINNEFPGTDVCLVIGANDVVNPAAKTDKTSPIYGMPILDASKARLVYCVKRSMKPGYAGVENELYYADNCMMIFGDAKAVCERLAGALRD
ncbi:MAG: NAD(P)(+) transhydrogenase (Re/Si-specific) subunit beta [Candidatus Sumerlaeia bacterium]|nr:NAD(P)(+) transhydrogenase (Re/Si-specific) subunit beta [Candidatus Sumerlaeia bacterium]